MNISLSSAPQIFAGSNPAAGGFRMDGKSDFLRIARACLANRGFRTDAGQPMAFARQLEYIFSEVFRAEFPEYKGTSLFEVNTEVDAGALSFTRRMISRVGGAQVINPGLARDLPNIDVEGSEIQQPIITIGASYQFSVFNEASASKERIAIEAEKARATREAIEQLEDNIWAVGYPNGGVPGVVNAPGVRRVAQASIAQGTWQAQIAAVNGVAPTTGAPYPAAQLAFNLATDINTAIATIYSQSLGKHNATHCALPTNLMSFLKFVPQSPAINTKSILQFLQEQTGLIFVDWVQLNNAGTLAGSTLNLDGTGGAQNTRVFVWEDNRDVMRLVQAQPFVQLAPQPTSLVWEIPCYSRVGGAMSVRPLGAVYIDGL